MTEKQFKQLLQYTRHTAPAGAYDVRSLASYLRIDAATVLRWWESGIVPGPSLLDPPAGCSVGIRRWRKCDIDRWLSSDCPRCEPPTADEFSEGRHHFVCEDLSQRITDSNGTPSASKPSDDKAE